MTAWKWCWPDLQLEKSSSYAQVNPQLYDAVTLGRQTLWRNTKESIWGSKSAIGPKKISDRQAETAVPQETAEQMDLLPPDCSHTNTSVQSSRANEGNWELEVNLCDKQVINNPKCCFISVFQAVFCSERKAEMTNVNRKTLLWDAEKGLLPFTQAYVTQHCPAPAKTKVSASLQLCLHPTVQPSSEIHDKLWMRSYSHMAVSIAALRCQGRSLT